MLRMDREPFLIDIRFNNIYYTKALTNSGSLYYVSVSEDLYYKLGLLRIIIPPRKLDGVVGTTS